MFTSLWGRHAWLFLHAIIYQRKIEPGLKWEPEVVKKFLYALGLFLPCPGCKGHYTENRMLVSPNYIEASESIEQLEKYFLGVHNAVNFTYHLPQVTIEEARLLHTDKVDWLKNFAYFFKAISILYKDPLPKEYSDIAVLETNKERQEYLDRFIKENPTRTKEYHSLKHHCVNSIYSRILEMTKEEQDKTVIALKKSKSRDLPSVKEFIRRKIDREGHFSEIKNWHWQDKDCHKNMKDLLNGLVLLFPGNEQRKIYTECIKNKPFLIDEAVIDNSSFKFWLARILVKLYSTDADVQKFEISPFNSEYELRSTGKNVENKKNRVELLSLRRTEDKLRSTPQTEKRDKFLKYYGEKIDAHLKQYPHLQSDMLDDEIISKNDDVEKDAGNDNSVLSGEVSTRTLYIFRHSDIQLLYSGLGLEKLGGDYGNTEHHTQYIKLVHEHIKKNGKVTYPNLSDEYKEVLKKRRWKKLSSAIIIQYRYRKFKNI